MFYKFLESVEYCNGVYSLGFNINGDRYYIGVLEEDHPLAELDENYFDDQQLVNNIVDEYIETMTTK